MQTQSARAPLKVNLRSGLVGVIDIGSNSVRLVIFEDGVRSPDYFFNEKIICGLGRELGETGFLNPEGKARALAALNRFSSLARRMGVGEIVAIGTAALRDAADGPAFRDQIAAETGVFVRVATGREEARMAAQGVLLGWPSAEGVVADLGGSSLELAEIGGGEVGSRVSIPAGHLRFADPQGAEARAALEALSAAAAPFAASAGRLILVGGAWRALAKAQMARTDYPFHVLQGFGLECAEALDLCDWVAGARVEEVKKAASVSSSRLASLFAGAITLRRLIEELAPDEVSISALGVREGIIYERMSDATRAEEPLLSAATRFESLSARNPGFGDELFEWMRPILSAYPEDWLRLSQASCILHDVNWRIHPDYRASACFATVTRANLGGVSHKGRLFMGAALMHRYKGAGDAHEAAAAVARLPEETRRAAEVVGRAARLGAMIAGSAKGMLAHCPLSVDGGALRLTFAPAAAELAGERVERRLRALADVMGLEAKMIA